MSWDYVALDKLGTVSRGRSKHRPRNDKSLFGGKYPFIQTADVKLAGLYLTKYSETYNEQGLNQSKLWPSGTLCITIAANIADTAILGLDACFPDSIIGFIPYENKANVKFVKYAFDILQRDCKNISQGTAQDNLSWEKLSTIKFPAPSIEIQNKIVEKLSCYDDLIENNQKQITLLEEAAQRLYKEWFIDLHFPGYEDVKIVDGVPEGWRKAKLEETCTRINAGSTPNRREANYWCTNDYKWYKTGELQDCWLIDSEEHISEEGYENSSTKLFPMKTILMAIYASPTIGRLGILESDATCNQAALCFEADENMISMEWLYLKLFELRNVFNSIAKGAGQQNISANLVKNMEIILPDTNVIKLFTAVTKKMFEMRLILQKQNLKLVKARDLLLPKLMSGEIEV